MMRWLVSLLGAALGAGLSYFVVNAVGAWYGPRSIHSDADINDFMVAGLLFQAVCGMGGAVVGLRLARAFKLKI